MIENTIARICHSHINSLCKQRLGISICASVFSPATSNHHFLPTYTYTLNTVHANPKNNPSPHSLNIKDASLAVRLRNHAQAEAHSNPPHHNRSYRALTPRTRILIGVGIMAYAGFGLIASDKAEQVFGYTPSEEDKARLREAVPRVHLVERGEGK